MTAGFSIHPTRTYACPVCGMLCWGKSFVPYLCHGYDKARHEPAAFALLPSAAQEAEQ